MDAVVVKVFRGVGVVASEPIASPVTAEQATECLQDTNAAWVGKLTAAKQNVALVGQQILTPGAIYHLYLQQSGRCTPAPVPGGVGPAQCHDPAVSAGNRLSVYFATEYAEFALLVQRQVRRAVAAYFASLFSLA